MSLLQSIEDIAATIHELAAQAFQELYDFSVGPDGRPRPLPRLRSFREVLNRYQAELNVARLALADLPPWHLRGRALLHLALALFWFAFCAVSRLLGRPATCAAEGAHRLHHGFFARRSSEGKEFRARRGRQLEEMKRDFEIAVPLPAVAGVAVLRPSVAARLGCGVEIAGVGCGKGTHEAALDNRLRRIQDRINEGQAMIDRFVDRHGMPGQGRDTGKGKYADPDFDSQTLVSVPPKMRYERELRLLRAQIDFSAEASWIVWLTCVEFLLFYRWCVSVRLDGRGSHDANGRVAM